MYRSDIFLLMGKFGGPGTFRNFLTLTFPQADDTIEKTIGGAL
jgi:hypothetical protein